MSIFIDFLAVLGGILVSVGVFLEFGLGFSLVSAGFFLIAFALLSAKVHEDKYVSDN